VQARRKVVSRRARHLKDKENVDVAHARPGRRHRCRSRRGCKPARTGHRARERKPRFRGRETNRRPSHSPKVLALPSPAARAAPAAPTGDAPPAGKQSRQKHEGGHRRTPEKAGKDHKRHSAKQIPTREAGPNLGPGSGQACDQVTGGPRPKCRDPRSDKRLKRE
jgi:hypothetical protein